MKRVILDLPDDKGELLISVKIANGENTKDGDYQVTLHTLNFRVSKGITEVDATNLEEITKN